MRFQVKVLDREGGTSVICLDARHKEEAAVLAECQGHAVLSVAQASLLAEIGNRRAGFPLKLFSQELLALLESGLTIVEGIEVLAEKERNPTVRETLGGILGQLREGKPLSAALEKMPQVFPALYVATIRASEKTSDLDEALRRFIDYQDQVDDLRSKLISASIYPALLIGAGSLIIVFLLVFVVPRFSRIYEDLHGELPWASRMMLEWGQLAENYGGWVAVAFLCSGVAAYRFLQRPAVREGIGAMLWRSPAVGERLRVFHLSRCYRTVGMLLRGGIPFTTALTMVTDLLAPALRSRLQAATRQVSEGVPASRALEEHGLTTPVAQRLLRVGERSGSMGEMMERIAAFHDREMARWIDIASRLFGPVLMMLIGLMIGIIVVLLYLPIFQMAESIG